MSRVYRRKFDWDEARCRYANGESVARIALDLGVTYSAVFRVVRPGEIERQNAYARIWVKRGRCDECGGPMNNLSRSQGSTKCRACASRGQVKRDTDGNIFCPSCATWKPPGAFSPSTVRKYRGVHDECRECDTARKREWRQRNRERLRAYDRERKRKARAAQNEAA